MASKASTIGYVAGARPAYSPPVASANSRRPSSVTA